MKQKTAYDRWALDNDCSYLRLSITCLGILNIFGLLWWMLI